LAFVYSSTVRIAVSLVARLPGMMAMVIASLRARRAVAFSSSTSCSASRQRHVVEL
jgi:hypothetical protein